ncbi:hypothetical protein [Olivibacter sp. XZL3]|nr:hypothetical protein [Olivibacter sp. XZL3]
MSFQAKQIERQMGNTMGNFRGKNIVQGSGALTLKSGQRAGK